MTFKTAMSNVGHGLLTATAVIHNSTLTTQIDEIDEEIKQLQEKKAELEAKLIKY